MLDPILGFFMPVNKKVDFLVCFFPLEALVFLDNALIKYCNKYGSIPISHSTKITEQQEIVITDHDYQ